METRIGAGAGQRVEAPRRRRQKFLGKRGIVSTVRGMAAPHSAAVLGWSRG